MAKLCFAKMNINEQIYDVYEGKDSVDRLTTEIYNQLTVSGHINDEYGARIKFSNLDRPTEVKVVTGRLVYINKEILSSYDDATDTITEMEEDNLAEYSTFYFDLAAEILAYTLTLRLGKKKVLDYWTRLIKEQTDVGVQFVQITDAQKLDRELAKITKLQHVVLKIVPPNDDKHDFDALFSLTAQRAREANVSNVKQEYSNTKDGLNKQSELMLHAIDGINAGYADGKFLGRDIHNEVITIDTRKDAPYQKNIDPDQKRSTTIVSEKSKTGIREIVSGWAQNTKGRKNNENKG